MNDRELEARLREALRLLVPFQDAPAQLYEHVARLGAGDSIASHEGPTAASRRLAPRGPTMRRLDPNRRVAGRWWSLAAAFAVVAVVATALSWRYSQWMGPGTATASPTASPSPSPSPQVSPTPSPAAETRSVTLGGRVGSQFGWVETNDNRWLYVTENGGRTWRDVTPPELVGKLDAAASAPDEFTGPWAITFADPQNGWLFYERGLGKDSTGQPISEHSFYRTADGGRTWTRSVFPAAPACQGPKSDWLDTRRGIALCSAADLQAQLWSTADGGLTWTQVSTWTQVPTTDPGNPAVVWPFWVELVTPLELWGSRPGALVLHSLDGGKTWTASELPDVGKSTGGGSFQLPTIVDGRLVVSAEAFRDDGKGGTSVDLVTWTSADDGAHWTLGTVAHLGDVSDLGPVDESSTLVPFLDAQTNDIRLFDRSSLTYAATLETAGFCSSASGGFVVQASAASPEDVWATCEYPGSSNDASYLYATTDGGKTWRSLMEAPKK
jgi:hypothetical protein